MSDLSPLRPIPSRSYAPTFLGTQEVYKESSASWVPKFTAGNGSSLYVSFGAGTVNGKLPQNWTEEFLIPPSSPRYVKLEVNGTIDGVSNVVLKVEASPTTENNTKKDYPPTKFSFILGTVLGTTASMAFTGPITVSPFEYFKEPKNSAPQPGLEPFNRYWCWQILSN